MNDLLDIVRHGFRHNGEGESPRVVVVGDLMLDRYLWGDVGRISPEAPVPVVRLRHEANRLGGAGNVAANLAALGVEVSLAGMVGIDAEADLLMAALGDSGIDTDGIHQCDCRSTITKTRVIGGHQQMLRLDREESGAYSESALHAMVEKIKGVIAAQQPEVLILSDYAKGVLTEAICQTLIATAKAVGTKVLVDPRGNDYSKYRGATGITPNKSEAFEVCAMTDESSEEMLLAVAQLRKQLELEFIAVTRGSEGISVIDAEGEQLYSAVTRQVYDVSGAGDTVIATLAASLAAGIEPARGCVLANVAAGVVVAKVGTTPIDFASLLQALEQQTALEQAHKSMDLETLAQQVESWRSQGVRIVFTNGCFDLLHAGHVSYLSQARKLGDRLIVGLNSDASVRRLKGEQRPLISEEDRAHVLSALESVSAVILFDDDTPLQLIKRLRPHVLVKGDDYSEADVVGAAEVKSWGGRVDLIPVLPGRSSSKIIERAGLGESAAQTGSVESGE